MKPFITKRIGRFIFDVGWFRGSEFCVFKFCMGEVIEAYPSGVDCVIIFHVQIAKASFDFGIDLGK